MYKHVLAIALATITMFASTGVAADKTHGNRYFGVNLGFFDAEVDGSNDGSINTIEGRVGGFFNDYLAAEVRAGTGITGDTVVNGTTEIDVDLNYMVGGYLKLGFPVHDQIFPYLLGGYTRLELEAESGGASTKGAETDASIGIGIDANVENLSISAEYVNLLDKNKASFSGFSIGLMTTF